MDFDMSSYSIPESSGSVEVCTTDIINSNAPGRYMEVTFIATDGSAISGMLECILMIGPKQVQYSLFAQYKKVTPLMQQT